MERWKIMNRAATRMSRKKGNRKMKAKLRSKLATQAEQKRVGPRTVRAKKEADGVDVIGEGGGDGEVLEWDRFDAAEGRVLYRCLVLFIHT